VAEEYLPRKCKALSSSNIKKKTAKSFLWYKRKSRTQRFEENARNLNTFISKRTGDARGRTECTDMSSLHI
jgi:hypothetical protein